MYIYPLMSKQANEEVKALAFGVIAALVREGNFKVIEKLLRSEIIPICLGAMKEGQIMTITVASYVFSKIIQNQAGLEFVCSSMERIFVACMILKNMVLKIV